MAFADSAIEGCRLCTSLGLPAAVTMQREMGKVLVLRRRIPREGFLRTVSEQRDTTWTGGSFSAGPQFPAMRGSLIVFPHRPVVSTSPCFIFW